MIRNPVMTLMSISSSPEVLYLLQKLRIEAALQYQAFEEKQA
jgi:hypothetical protein